MKKLWNRSLAFKFFISYLAVVSLLLVSFYLYSSASLRNFYVSWLLQRMEEEAHLLARVLPAGIEGPEFDRICQQQKQEIGARITVIAPDGRVLCDSDEQSVRMENHANRPEVIDALAQQSGWSVRHSATVKYDMLYRAFVQTNGATRRIIRVARPLTAIDGVIGSLCWTLFGGLLLASALGLALA